MKRKLASIQKILNIEPIPDADKIEVVQILGWKIVTKKGEYQVGDLVVYVEIDALLPEGNPHFEFLRDKKFRIRTLKLRGQVSQGIVFPLEILPPRMYYDEGADVTEDLGVNYPLLKEGASCFTDSASDSPSSG